MAQGFQNTVDPRSVVKDISNQMSSIVQSTTNKLGSIDKRLTDDEKALDELDQDVEDTNVRITDLEEEVKKINSPEYAYSEDENIIGIQPKRTDPFYRLHADRSDKDGDGRNIKETYIAKDQTVSSTVDLYKPENKTKIAQAQAITGMMSVSGHQLILGI